MADSWEVHEMVEHDHDAEDAVELAFEDPTPEHIDAAGSAVARLRFERFEVAHQNKALVGEVTELRRELSVARAIAWGYEHGNWDRRWFPSSMDGGTKLVHPQWLSSPVLPAQQSWFVAPVRSSVGSRSRLRRGLVSARARLRRMSSRSARTTQP